MKISNINSPQFQKKLVAKAKITSGDGKIPVKIYHLDKQNDEQIFTRAIFDYAWNGNRFLESVADEFYGCYDKDDYYAIMDNSGKKMFGYCVVGNIPAYQHLILHYIEVAPFYSSRNKFRTCGRIGETLMAFLAKLAKNNDKDIYVGYVINSDDSHNFYYNTCNFLRLGHEKAMLKTEDMQALIDKQEQKTGHKIEMLDVKA